MAELTDINNDERTFRRIPLEIVALAALLAFPVGLIFDWQAALLFLAGGGFAALNFIWIKGAVTHFLNREKKKALVFAAAGYVLRLLLILVLFSIIIFFFSKRILAFVGGFTTLLPIFFVEALLAYMKMQTWKR
ncbi:MAG: ATP synthase subunit I [Candidatus Aminicenantes bacterium]|nr:ATP synthase subunit I [Candidatus Aminicenantes bacterium]